jgi:hypothetical protein
VKREAFDVKEPTWLPFAPTYKDVLPGPMPGPGVEITVADGNRVVTWHAYPVEAIPPGSESWADVELESGAPTIFFDNGHAKMLTWLDDGTVYTLIAVVPVKADRPSLFAGGPVLVRAGLGPRLSVACLVL